MSLVASLVDAICAGSIDVVDLTAPLSERTPVIRLPEDHGQAWPFSRERISRYDEAGSQAYWSNVRLSEHTGTHFDAPVHWVSGRDLEDVSRVPPRRLVAPAAVLDRSADAAADPDFLLRREHVEAWQAEHGPLPDSGWLLLRTGWDARGGDAERFLNGGHTPGVEPACASWLARETPIVGIGVETVGTDAGQAASFDQPFPCHWYFHGAGKYGLTQLRNLELLPPSGAVLVVAPLPIVDGSGSPCRVLALVEREGA
jgi:kynurenine formamidase